MFPGYVKETLRKLKTLAEIGRGKPHGIGLSTPTVGFPWQKKSSNNR